MYTFTTLASAIAGSIAPFMPGFNEVRNKVSGRVNDEIPIERRLMTGRTHTECEDHILCGHLDDCSGSLDASSTATRYQARIGIFWSVMICVCERRCSSNQT